MQFQLAADPCRGSGNHAEQCTWHTKQHLDANQPIAQRTTVCAKRFVNGNESMVMFRNNFIQSNANQHLNAAEFTSNGRGKRTARPRIISDCIGRVPDSVTVFVCRASVCFFFEC